MSELEEKADEGLEDGDCRAPCSFMYGNVWHHKGRQPRLSSDGADIKDELMKLSVTNRTDGRDTIGGMGKEERATVL